MESEMKPAKSEEPIWKRLIKYFCPWNKEYSNIFTVFAGDNLNKQKKVALLVLQIFYWINFGLIPLAIFSLHIILQKSGFKGYSGEYEVMVVVIYIISIGLSIIGYKRLFWVKIFVPGDDYAEIFIKHVSRMSSCYGSIIGLAFVVGLISTNWYITSPLFILAAFDLFITYPTSNRWNEWLKESELSG
jgi:hypothetical protein